MLVELDNGRYFEKICNDRKLFIAQDKLPLQKLIDLASNIDSKSTFLSNIANKQAQKQVAIIAEIGISTI